MSALEQLKQLKSQLVEESSSLRPPFPFISINYDEEIGEVGAFILGGEKKNGEWVAHPTILKTLELVVLKERGQYTYYNEQLNRLTVKSNIVPRYQAKQAVDLISGKTIEELRKSGVELTYNLLLLVLVKVENAFIPAILKLKGATLKSWIDFTREHGNVEVDTVLSIVTQKEKKGTVKYFTLSFSAREITEDEARAVVSILQSAVDAFEDWTFAYNNRNLQTAQTTNGNGEGKQEESVWQEGSDDDIPF